MEYSEIEDQRKKFYFDQQVPGESAFFSQTIDVYTPIFETWFQKKRSRPIHLISSAETSRPSFANFILDTVEVQSLGRGGRDLLLHEMTHNYMYEHFHNFLGPAGAIIYLPWVPAWWIEGLAEAMTVSDRSDRTAALERNMALSDRWPSFDRLHSLYHSSVAFEGYAVSGNFVRYILRRMKVASLGPTLESLRSYSEPWWWPWTLVPFNDFLPLDAVLKDALGKTSEELYEEYKADAKKHWLAQKELVPLDPNNSAFIKGSSYAWRYIDTIMVRNEKAYAILGSGDEAREEAVRFYKGSEVINQEVGKPKKPSSSQRLPSYLMRRTRLVSPRFQVGFETEADILSGKLTSKMIISKGDKRLVTLQSKRLGYVEEIWETKQRLYWLSTAPDVTRICYIDWKDIEKRNAKKLANFVCPIEEQIPHEFRILNILKQNTKGGSWATSALISRDFHSTKGDVYVIEELDLETLKRKVIHRTLARPIRATPVEAGLLILQGESSRQNLMILDQQNMTCKFMLPLQNLVSEMYGLSQKEIVLAAYNGGVQDLHLIDVSKIPWQGCYEAAGHKSPIIYAAQHGGNFDFVQALQETDLWRADIDQVKPGEVKLPQAGVQQDVKDMKEDLGQQKQYSWGARPKFMFPWIGGDDAYGTQLGIVSVPLMDHLQNETVRLTALVGVESVYPSTDISLMSTRFAPTLTTSVFRQQTYNGSFGGRLLYYDEKGVRVSADLPLYFMSHSQRFSLSGKFSHLKPYMGFTNVRQGRLNELGAGWSLGKRFSWIRFSLGLNGTVAPEDINNEFDYNRIAANIDSSIPLFWASSLNFGVEGSRTRGKERKALMEVYRPLKTFIPGSGGGFNQNSFLVAGDGYMFGAQFGDTQTRAKASYTVPVIRDLDEQIWILYFERLDFTAFYNYGGAWYDGFSPPAGRLISAHGYNLDLQLENKGVRFNIGGGIGQVLSRPIDIYATAGFDALF